MADTVKILEIANTVEVAQDGRIHLRRSTGRFYIGSEGTPAEYKAGLDLATLYMTKTADLLPHARTVGTAGTR